MRYPVTAVAPLTAIFLAGASLLVSGCDNQAPEAQATGAATGEATEAVVPATMPSGGPSDGATGAVAGAVMSDLDVGALEDRRDPERLLRFYSNALRVGDWQAAARAWSLDAQMTPEKLSAQFGGSTPPKIAVGKGDTESAAGTSFYEAPIVIDFADGRPSLRGTVVLRRANDVPGASEEQLVWRIERSSTLVQ